MISSATAMTTTKPQNAASGGTSNSRSVDRPDELSESMPFDALLSIVVPTSFPAWGGLPDRTDFGSGAGGLSPSGARGDRIVNLKQEDQIGRANGDSRIAGATDDATRIDDLENSLRDAPNEVDHERGTRPAGDSPKPDRTPIERGNVSSTSEPGGLTDRRNVDPHVRESGVNVTSDRSGPAQMSAGRPATDSVGSPTASTGSAVKDSLQSPTNRIPKVATVQPGQDGVPRSQTVGNSARAETARGVGRSIEGNESRVGDGRPKDVAAQNSRGAQAGKSRSTESRQHAVFERIAHVARMARQGRDVEARIRLDPPSLGQVRIKVQIKDSAIDLQLVAESRDTRDLLSSQSDQLQSALERHGLRVDRLLFATPPSGEENAPASHQEAGVGQHDTNTGGHHGERSIAQTVSQDTAWLNAEGSTSDGDVGLGTESILVLDRIDVRV